MEEVTYNVFLVPGPLGEAKVLLAPESVTEIEDAVHIGDINHPHANDDLGPTENHVLIQHIRQMLYYVDKNGDPSFWPDNITDMSRMSIEMYNPEEGTDPDPDPENPGEGEG